MGLDDSYYNVRSQILMMEHLPPPNKVFALIQQDRKQKDVASKNQSNVEVTTFISKLMTGSMNSSCNWRPMYNNQGFKKDRLKRSYCGMLGHLQEKYYKLHGYSPGHD